ncbi:MAG: hypothetical protein AB1393_13850 [Candidatus Edwardsbacteria bacterium]
MKWSFAQVWNKSLEREEEGEIRPRQKIWASELDKAYVDRWLKMKGVLPTNLPNARSRRKFEAGNMLEWIVKMVLKRAGILQSNQKWTEYQYEGLLPVSGKLDFVAGGQPDWEKTLQEIELLGLPEFFNQATHQIIKHLKGLNRELERIIIEVKSCSTYMYDRYESFGLESTKGHVMQTFHYLKAENMPEAHLVYICKDDLRMLEFSIMNPSQYENWYKQDIEEMTEYYNSDVLPPLEPEIIFNEDTGRFSTNWKVEYSTYLTKLYNYKEPTDYRERWNKTIAQWNRTLRRCVEDKKMTDLNLQTIKEIEMMFPDFDEFVEKAKKVGITEKEEQYDAME